MKKKEHKGQHDSPVGVSKAYHHDLMDANNAEGYCQRQQYDVGEFHGKQKYQ